MFSVNFQKIEQYNDIDISEWSSDSWSLSNNLDFHVNDSPGLFYFRYILLFILRLRYITWNWFFIYGDDIVKTFKFLLQNSKSISRISESNNLVKENEESLLLRFCSVQRSSNNQWVNSLADKVSSPHQDQIESRISISLINVHLPRFELVAIFSHFNVTFAWPREPIDICQNCQSTDQSPWLSLLTLRRFVSSLIQLNLGYL